MIAGHGKKPDGTIDPGATGIIAKGENRYMKEDLFPAMKKYMPDNADGIFFTDYDVYSKGNLVALANKYGKDTEVIEFHYDATGTPDASGGHVIVHSEFSPDATDLKIRDVIKKHIGIRYNHKGHAGISGRDTLANANRAYHGDINYRLLELGFGTSPVDAKIMVNNVDAIAKDMVLALFGKIKEAPVKPKPSKPSTSNKSHKVVSGDTLWGIAAKNRIEVSDLKRWNQLTSTTILPGQTLVLKAPARTYTVKSGDNLGVIGERLKVNWMDIAKLNGIKNPYIIQPGQKLKY